MDGGAGVTTKIDSDNAAYIAAADPPTVLALLDVVEAAEAFADESGIGPEREALYAAVDRMRARS